MIMIPRNREWGDLIEDCYGKNVRKTVRYAIKKEPDIFDREKLREAVEGLPDGYTLKMIDGKLFRECRETEWGRGLTATDGGFALF